MLWYFFTFLAHREPLTLGKNKTNPDQCYFVFNDHKMSEEFELNLALKNNYVRLPSFFLSSTKSIQCCLDSLFWNRYQEYSSSRRSKSPFFTPYAHNLPHNGQIFLGFQFLFSCVFKTISSNSECDFDIFKIEK